VLPFAELAFFADQGLNRDLEAALAQATPAEVARLDRDRRSSGADNYRHTSWLALRPHQLDPVEPALVALASMHSNGFVRERATELLATRTDGGEIPYLLVRVNDWVPSIRARAEKALRARITPDHAASFVASLGLMESLRVVRRAPPGALIASIEASLATAPARAALGNGLRSTDRAVRRACARIGAATGDTALLLEAVGDADPVVATFAAQAIVTTWTGDALREVLPRLRGGPPRLRGLAIEAVCARLAAEAEPHLRAALLDPASGVREIARFQWGKSGLAPIDFASFYRDAIARGEAATFAAALRGLAETGTQADAPLFEPYLGNPRSAVRAAAVMGLGRCGFTRYGDALLAAMKDPSPSVANVARSWVRVRLGRALARRH
jgi:hypothetical protein